MVVPQTSWIECTTQQAVALSDHSNKNPPKHYQHKNSWEKQVSNSNWHRQAQPDWLELCFSTPINKNSHGSKLQPYQNPYGWIKKQWVPTKLCAQAKTVFFCARLWTRSLFGDFNMRVYVESLILEPRLKWNCSFWHLHVGFVFQTQEVAAWKANKMLAVSRVCCTELLL